MVERGRARGEASPVRVLTTTYIGASEVRALDELARIGAEVRISYDDRRTRLHAKAWLFHRESGSHTAYIGSSNLSRSALHEGLEWNVRLSWRDSGPLLTKFRAAFESYRGADEFVPYDPGRDRERVVRALAAQRTRGSERPLALRVDMTPHPHQTPMLEALRVERGRGHLRNLLVAPTGTGKTLVAAFDYAELRRDLPRARLLFVAHRERILTQSRGWFATVLKDSDFGELLTGETKVESGEHVFATIRSLSRMSLDAELPPEHFDVVIVDEFHHAEAQIEAGFPYLPPGCAMQLDRKAQGVVLSNIRHSIGAGQKWLQQELAAMGAGTTVGEFLREAGVEPVDLYASGRSFASLRHAAFGSVPLDEEARRRHARLRGLLHVNDPLRLGFLRDRAAGEPLPSGERGNRLAAMAAAALLDVKRPAEAWGALEAACANETFRQELGQLVGFLEDGRREGVLDWRGLGPAPLQVHARYRQDEILAALRARGEMGISQIQGGVYYEPVNNADILFVTLRKDEGSFSPTTMYRDYAISPSRFHWESQNWAHSGSAAGRRYLAGSSHVLLFVREVQDQANGVAEAYTFLGKATLESSEGERPMRIVWRLEHPMPGPLYTHATVAAG